MARKATMTESKLSDILRAANLSLAEEFDKRQSYPKNRFILCECNECHVQAHYQIRYVIEKTGSPSTAKEPVCRACHWRQWFSEAPTMRSEPISLESAKALAEENGFELVDLVNRESPGCEIFVVRCKVCGRQSVKRLGDLGWGCSCQSHPRGSDSKRSAGGGSQDVNLLCESGEPCLEWWAHDLNDEDQFLRARRRGRASVSWRCPECGRVFSRPIHAMTSPNVPSCPDCAAKRSAESRAEMEALKRTPVSEVPELLEAWDDERDPRTVMVYPTNYHGMVPGDGLCRFRCPNGHHPQSVPYTYLKSGCPFCKGEETKKSEGGFISDADPELADEWAHDKNGSYTPDKVRPNSKRTVTWRCLRCGHEWEAKPRERTKTRGGKCPSCGKILGSLAWRYPHIAETWSPDNPISPWEIAPNAKLSFTPSWFCESNPEHVYTATIPSRLNGAGCPECKAAGKSRIELKYFKAIDREFGHARSGVKLESEGFEHPWVVDVLFRVHGRDVVVEYDGSHWHADKEDVDRRKSVQLLQEGYVVIRLREDPLPTLGIDGSDYHELEVNANAPRVSAVVRQLRDLLAE